VKIKETKADKRTATGHLCRNDHYVQAHDFTFN